MTATRKKPIGFSKWESVLVKAIVILLASLWIYSPVFDCDWLWDGVRVSVTLCEVVPVSVWVPVTEGVPEIVSV
jgi:hypothetical protein